MAPGALMIVGRSASPNADAVDSFEPFANSVRVDLTPTRTDCGLSLMFRAPPSTPLSLYAGGPQEIELDRMAAP